MTTAATTETNNPPTPAPTMFQPIGEAVQTLDTVPEGAGAEIETDPQVVDNIDSLCMNCEEQGVTRLFLTRIPFFKEVVLMSFECPHCGYRNSEIQSAGQIQERGCQYVFKVTTKKDLNRQLVKSETCTSSFPELDLEIPAQRGHLTTIEGLLTNVLEDLSSDQPLRKHSDPESYEKIEAFCDRIRKTIAGDEAAVFPFHVKLDDPAGNSWVEPQPGDPRGKWVRTDYIRTREQNEALALTDTGDTGVEREAGGQAEEAEGGNTDFRHSEVHTFPATCPSCVRPCNTYMKFVDIPHFKEVVIMSTVCDDCGYKSNEVKTGGAVPEKGIRITLNVQDEDDLARDILKSETCALTCPELNLDLTPGTLGGRFTTLEGLLSQVHDDLHSRIFTSPNATTISASSSDSLDAESRARWESFFEGLREAKEGKRKFTLIMEDPMGASYLQNLYAPDPDPGMTVEEYERTEEQEEELGLRDMKVEGYEKKEDEKEEVKQAVAA